MRINFQIFLLEKFEGWSEMSYSVTSRSGKSKLLSRVPQTESDDVICSRSCPGRGGTRPSLSCKQCLNYFHPKCVMAAGEEVSISLSYLFLPLSLLCGLFFKTSI